MRRPYFYVALFGLTGCLEVAGGVPSGADGGADAGGNAARDAGTSAVVDGGTPAVDSGTGNTPIDAGATPPLDAGQPKPVDAGAPPTDAGPPPTDAGQSTRADGGLGSVDAGPSTVTSFQLTSSTGGTALPFSVGLGFRRGDVPTGFAFELPSGQVDVKRRWPDGSVKHAIASGHIDLVANVPKTVALVGGAFVGGTALRCEDITAAAPSASVKAGSLGTVELSSLLGSPLRTWLSGPEVVECHYGAPVGSDPTLHVFFHVRLFKNGRLFVRAIVENGQLTTNTTDKSYVPTVTVGSTTVFTNGGAALTHYAHTRWLAEGWLGGDPGVVARHDVAALMRTKLVPNYWHKPATEASLNAPTRQYTPMAQGDWTQNMGDTGFQPPIGLLPSWEARYFTSNGDPRALAATLANAKTLNSYGIVWRDTDQLPVQPSKRPTWTVDGEGAGGENGVNAGPLNWELAHHCSGGYLAYLLTGEYFYLETMQLQAATVYLVNSSSHGSGTNRLLSGQTRAAAWSTRTVGQLAGLAPLDEVTQDYRALLASNAQQWDAERQSTPSQALGMFYDYGFGTAYGPGLTSPWQHNFWALSNGLVSDLEPLDDMAAFNRVRDATYLFTVGMLGDSSGYCFTKASVYTVKVGTGATFDTLYGDWHAVYAATYGTAACGNSLEGESGGAVGTATGYWANLLPAIAYAVDQQAPGAAQAWARLTGATNWSTFATSGFEEEPVWAVVPRGFE